MHQILILLNIFKFFPKNFENKLQKKFSNFSLLIANQTNFPKMAQLIDQTLQKTK